MISLLDDPAGMIWQLVLPGDNLLLFVEDFALDTTRRELRRGKLRPHIRFGSKADMCNARGYVRFTLNSDIDCVFRHVRFGPVADSFKKDRLKW